MALEAVQAVTTLYVVTIKQIKNKHDTYKKDWKVWKELCSQSSQGWDNEKGVPVAAEDIIDIYFEANPDAAKFRNAPLPHLQDIQELFKGVIATGSYAITVDEALQQIHGEIPVDP